MELSVELHNPAALPPGKEPPVTIVYEAGWASGYKMASVICKIKHEFRILTFWIPSTLRRRNDMVKEKTLVLSGT
jgi:hypothetical protein